MKKTIVKFKQSRYYILGVAIAVTTICLGALIMVASVKGLL